MNRKRTLILIIILFTGLFPLIPIPIAKATEATVSIERSEDDVWMTEIGNIFGYESSVRMLDPEIGIRSFLRFEDVPLLKSSKINYATLYVYAGWDQGETISPGASVTIYGIDEPDCAPFSYSGRVWSLERPYTSASVNWNVSDWHYSTWKSVNVTSIVKEIINQYAWTQNNSIGFQILGASDTGYEYRTFEDIDHQHHGAYAYLYFQYDGAPDTPPGLPDTAEWVETYGEVDIWTVPGKNETLGYSLDPMEYTYINGTTWPRGVNYQTIEGGDGGVEISDVWVGSQKNAQRKLIRLLNGTMYAVYAKEITNPQIHVEHSNDNGMTWIGDVLLSTLAGMSSNPQSDPSIAVDSNDVVHIVWEGEDTEFNNPQIWYTTDNGTGAWSTPFRLSNVDYYHYEPCIAVDSNDDLHVVFYGQQRVGANYPYHIWHVKYTGSWSAPLKISTLDDMLLENQYSTSIALDSNDYIHVVWYGLHDDYGSNDQIWYALYNGSWVDPLRISTLSGMQNFEQEYPCIAVDSSDAVHVVFEGVDHGETETVRHVAYTDSWGTIEIISGGNKGKPSIAIDSNDYLHVLFSGVEYTNYTTSWSEPITLQTTTVGGGGALRWARWPGTGEPITPDTFYLVDENNTVIETWNGDNETDIDDLKDWYDDYGDPEGGDPLDPDPGTQGWDTEGPWTRFNTRLYFLVIGLGCVFAPIWAMAYKKFDSVGYAWCFIVMVLGVGLLWSITGI